LTGPPSGDPGARRQPARRFFSDAIALESDQPGLSVSHVARKHGIVTGMLFRWRVQFGVAQKKRAKLAPVALTDGTPAALLLPTSFRASTLSLARRLQRAWASRLNGKKSPSRRCCHRCRPAASTWCWLE
jgi:transposase-like protein